MTHDRWVTTSSDTTARYTRVATGMIANIESPLDLLAQPRKKGKKPNRRSSRRTRRRPPRAPAGVIRRSVPSKAGGRGHLPRPRGGVALGQCRSRQPRPVEGHVGHRALPHGGARRACRALREVLAHHHRLQLLPQPPLPEVPGRGGDGNGWPSARQSCCRCRTITWYSRCRLGSPTSPIRTRP